MAGRLPTKNQDQPSRQSRFRRHPSKGLQLKQLPLYAPGKTAAAWERRPSDVAEERVRGGPVDDVGLFPIPSYPQCEYPKFHVTR